MHPLLVSASQVHDLTSPCVPSQARRRERHIHRLPRIPQLPDLANPARIATTHPLQARVGGEQAAQTLQQRGEHGSVHVAVETVEA